MISAIRSLVASLRYPSLTALSRNEFVLDKAKVLVRVYYAMLLFASYFFLLQWAAIPPAQNFAPLWPLGWSSLLDIDVVLLGQCIRVLLIVAALAAVVSYDRWYVRALAFVGVWQAHAFASSFGAENHQWYGWLFTSLIFILIPDSIWRGAANHEERRIFLLTIWWAQACIMLTYTLAGMWKLIIGVEQVLAGEISGFAPLGLAYQIADWLPKLGNEAMLAWLIIDHPYVGWAAYLFVQYMQFFALYTMVRPTLQKFWGFELVLFHIGTFVLMGITFSEFIPLLLALFFFSPFVPDRVTWKDILFDMPIIGQVLTFVWPSLKRA